MPPKPKFTREEIVAAALSLLREQGESALTAREIGKRLGTSSSPIFTTFKDMEELKAAVQLEAKAVFDRYMEVAKAFFPSYKEARDAVGQIRTRGADALPPAFRAAQPRRRRP